MIARKFSMYTPQRFPSHLEYVASFPCEKCYWFWHFLTVPQPRVDMYLETLWWLDLTFNNSQIDCLKTADTDWLTNILKLVRRRLESTVKRCTVEHCCIKMIFFHYDYLHTVIILHTLYFVYCTHILVKSLAWYFCSRLRRSHIKF